MNCKKRIAALLVASAFAAAPAWLSAQDKPTTPAKSAAPAKAAATAKPAAPAKAAQPAAGGSAAENAWKELSGLKDPPLDRTKTQDQAYVQKYIADRQAAMTKRRELATAFVEKYPDSSHLPDALFMQAQTATSAEEFKGPAEAFLQAAPADPRAVSVMSTLASIEKDQAKQLQMLKDVVAKFPNAPEAAQAKGQIKMAEAVGKPFEYPTFKDAINGNEISPATLKGKVVVVDFWATWCGPCVGEMPHMKELYAKFKDQGVEFLGISLDQPESEGGLTKLKEFCAQNQITWPQYYQGNGWASDFSKGWGVNSIPCVFIVDAEGKLHTTQGRGKLEEILPELIKKAGKKEVSGTALPF